MEIVLIKVYLNFLKIWIKNVLIYYDWCKYIRCKYIINVFVNLMVKMGKGLFWLVWYCYYSKLLY